MSGEKDGYSKSTSSGIRAPTDTSIYPADWTAIDTYGTLPIRQRQYTLANVSIQAWGMNILRLEARIEDPHQRAVTN